MKKQACGHEKPHYAHGLCKLCYDKQWRTPEKHRIYNLRHQRGLEAEEYQSLLDAQHGKCAICGGTEVFRGDKYLPVDHDHQTGKVRGILCSRCNTGLGGFKDSKDLLQKAIEYLDIKK